MLKHWCCLHLIEGLQATLMGHSKSPPLQPSKCHPPKFKHYCSLISKVINITSNKIHRVIRSCFNVSKTKISRGRVKWIVINYMTIIFYEYKCSFFMKAYQRVKVERD